MYGTLPGKTVLLVINCQRPLMAFLAAAWMFAAAGTAHGQSRDLARADSLYARALALRTDNVDSLRAGIAVLKRIITVETDVRRVKNLGAAWNTLGHFYLDLEQVDSAAHAYRTALSIRRAASDTAGVAGSTNNLGNVFRLRGELDSAVVYYRTSAAIHLARKDQDAAAITLENLAFAYADSTGDRAWADSALAVLHRVVELRHAGGDLAGAAEAAFDLARKYKSAAQLDSAMSLSRRALAWRRQAQHAQGEAASLYEIGSIYSRLFQRDSAVAYYRAAADVDIRNEEWARAASAIQSIAEVYDDYLDEAGLQRAIATFHEAIELWGRAGSRRGEGRATASLAVTLADRGRPDSARIYARRALQVNQEIKDPVIEILMTGVLGGVHPQPDSGLILLRRAADLAAQKKLPQLQIRLLRNIAYEFRSQQQTDSAVHYHRQALTIARNTGNAHEVLRSLNLIGGTYRIAAPPRYALAAAYHDSAWLAVEQTRRRAGSDTDRIFYADEYSNIARQLTSVLHPLADQSGKQSDRWLAFAAMERARARGLIDMLRDSAEQAPNLQREAEWLQAGATRGGAAIIAFTVGGDVTAELILPDGRIEVFTVQPKDSLRAEDLVRQRVAEVRAALYVDSAAVRTVDGELESKGPGVVRRAGSRTGAQALSASLQQISAVLLPPRLQQRLLSDSSIHDVVVIVDGPAAQLPFGLLPLGDGTQLGQRYALRYAPSLTALLAADGKSPSSSKDARPLVVGNPVMPSVQLASGTKARLKPLPAAETEAVNVASMLGVNVLLADQATETNVTAKLPTANVVHFATHGYAYGSEARMRDSFIALAPDAKNDGLLTAGEILDAPYRLAADLVVLSACQTALGTQMMAEGTVGLQRAFLAKGARSLLVSLWSVDDEATKSLMLRFYQHWVGGKSKAESLRLAQQEMSRIPKYTNPRYWAAFQLVGAN